MLSWERSKREVDSTRENVKHERNVNKYWNIVFNEFYSTPEDEKEKDYIVV